MALKLCMNCKWFKESHGYANCRRPLGIEPVYGNMRYNVRYCHHERDYSRSSASCGEKGQFFEPAPKLAPPPPAGDDKFKDGPIVDHDEPPTTKNMLATILTNWGMGKH